MQSLWVENNILSVRNDLPIPALEAGQALIRVRLAGVCSTDLAVLGGYSPFVGVPGHEFVGQVVAAPGAPEWVGQRVVGEINITCGVCAACRAGRKTHCEKRSALGIHSWNGAFAEYLKLPLANLYRVPDTLSDEGAVFTEPLAAALEIQEQLPGLGSERILVVGAGRLGQLVAQTLALTGCDLQVIARYPRQRQLLERRQIAWLPEEALPIGCMDVVVEATGSPAGFEMARKALRARGTLVLKSTYKGDVTLNLSSLVVDEITLIGSRCGPFEPALALLANGQVDPRDQIEACYPLAQAQQAYEEAGQHGRIKVLLAPSSG